jgi:hypothetical protein
VKRLGQVGAVQPVLQVDADGDAGISEQRIRLGQLVAVFRQGDRLPVGALEVHDEPAALQRDEGWGVELQPALNLRCRGLDLCHPYAPQRLDRDT